MFRTPFHDSGAAEPWYDPAWTLAGIAAHDEMIVPGFDQDHIWTHPDGAVSSGFGALLWNLALWFLVKEAGKEVVEGEGPIREQSMRLSQLKDPSPEISWAPCVRNVRECGCTDSLEYTINSLRRRAH
ncbi:hypothetical protein EJB05_41208, partial [Eragrostis curvula]